MLSVSMSSWSAGRGWLGAVLAAFLLAACVSTPLPPYEGPQVVVPGANGRDEGATRDEDERATFRAVLSGANAIPPNLSGARGELVAVLDPHTGVLRWRLSFTGLETAVRRAGFHSPGMEGEVAPLVVPIGSVSQSPFDGRAQLTRGQAQNLLAGQWYVNLPTALYPEGELRGQLIEQR